ncbi:MAG TPA: hypothetical protein VFV15_05840 [Moraxellaceae bacterium]|nr:hypothetical protein [Moraxellaceae bacterium]
MPTYFAIKLADPVQQRVDELLRNLDAGVSAPQHDLHTRVSIELSDEIMRVCVEEMIARFQAGGDGEGAGILHTLLGILKSTSHMLIRQLLGKTGNDEVNRMAQFLRDRRHVLNGQVLCGFEMPADLAARFDRAFAAIAAGEGEAQRGDIQQAMLAFADLALARYYDDFVAYMNLGFIKRKASDLGRATISKGMHVAVNKLFPTLRQKELQVWADYFSTLFVKA